jgi:hypothetical protein
LSDRLRQQARDESAKRAAFSLLDSAQFLKDRVFDIDGRSHTHLMLNQNASDVKPW